MAEHHRFPGGSLGRRHNRRWAIAGGVGLTWALLLYATGSFIVGTTVLVLLAAVAAAGYAVLRSLGFNAEHPWVQSIRTRPWRDGQDVLRLGLRRLPEVLIITPNGSRVAPNFVELRMNPDDLLSLAESLDMKFINSSATEFYQELLTRRAIRTAAEGPVQVSIVGDPRVPAGRYALRKLARPRDPALMWDPAAQQWDPAAQPWDQAVQQWDPGAQPGDAQPGEESGVQSWEPIALPGEGSRWYHDGYARDLGAASHAPATGMATIMESPSPPLLRLITGGQVAETRVSGARAGRDAKLELALPADPTVSRVHAEFTFRKGQWWITNLGRNGITLNGESVDATHPIRGGDSIGWGRRQDALVSKVEVDCAPEPADHTAWHGTLTTRTP